MTNGIVNADKHTTDFMADKDVQQPQVVAASSTATRRPPALQRQDKVAETTRTTETLTSSVTTITDNGAEQTVVTTSVMMSRSSTGTIQPPIRTTPNASPNFGRSSTSSSSSSGKKIPLSQRKKLNKFVLKSPTQSTQKPGPLNDFLGEENFGKITVKGKDIDTSQVTIEVREILGRGAFGTVRKILLKEISEEFAVKQIRDSMNAQARKELLMDLNVIKGCECPHIVSYFGFDFKEGEIWIYMELMMGSLDQIYNNLKQHNQIFPEPVLGKMTCSILAGLHYLKSNRKVMHRDVKPSNILFGFDGSIKLCDFGISKTLEKSISKTAVGCERYLPPERLDPSTSRQPYDVRSDVWAFGVTLVELATLDYPYPEDHVFQRLTAIVDGDPPSVPEDSYSENFRDLVALCLQKKKEHRPKYSKPPQELPQKPSLLDHPFIKLHSDSDVDLRQWYDSAISDEA